jgi:hypothetical protein
MGGKFHEESCYKQVTMQFNRTYLNAELKFKNLIYTTSKVHYNESNISEKIQITKSNQHTVHPHCTKYLCS